MTILIIGNKGMKNAYREVVTEKGYKFLFLDGVDECRKISRSYQKADIIILDKSHCVHESSVQLKGVANVTPVCGGGKSTMKRLLDQIIVSG